ncbi:MAG: hypothetical protein H6734_07940 [Alphaproteobacteria bacterium]|nr:hypothetical protein [Alphaproteobacteria bacterium]
MLLVLAAYAHVGDVLDTLDAHVDPATPSRVHVEATFGLVTLEGDAGAWVCHEAVTAPGVFAAPHYVQGSTGRFAAWNSGPNDGRDGEPVWTSADRCDWTALTGLAGQLVAEVSLRGDEAWAATATSGVTNGLYRTVDGAFVPAGVSSDTDIFLSVRAEGPAIWAVSTDGDVLTLWHSTDGTAFTSHTVAPPDGVTLPLRGSIGAIDPTDGDRAWLVMDPIGVDFLYELTEAGATQTSIWAPPDRLTDLTRLPDGALLAVLNDRRPWRGVDGVFTEMAVEDASGGDVGPEGLWLSNRTYVNGLFATLSTDGHTAARTLGPEVIASPLSCPAGSTQVTICEPLWDALSLRLQPQPTGDSGTPTPIPPPVVEEPSSCGCAAGTLSGVGGPGALAIPWLLRRRRNRRSPRAR